MQGAAWQFKSGPMASIHAFALGAADFTDGEADRRKETRTGMRALALFVLMCLFSAGHQEVARSKDRDPEVMDVTKEWGFITAGDFYKSRAGLLVCVETKAQNFAF